MTRPHHNTPPSTPPMPYTGPERRSSMRVWQDKVDRRFQARAALHNAGLFPAVEALMAHEDTPMIVKLAWTDAQEFRRTSPTVQALAGAMNLTDEQVDALFVAAAGIEA